MNLNSSTDEGVGRWDARRESLDGGFFGRKPKNIKFGLNNNHSINWRIAFLIHSFIQFDHVSILIK